MQDTQPSDPPEGGSPLADDHAAGLATGFGPENVEGLREAHRAHPHFDLLRGLTAGGDSEFLLRFGAVADLVHADQTLWTLDAMERRLCWMEPERLTSTIRTLKRSGWLETVGIRYRLSSDGLAVYATLARLGTLHTGRDDSLAMGVFDLEASTRLDEDVRPALRHLQHHLRRAVEDVEAAVKSQSELKVLEARDKLDKNLQWSQRARMLLDRLDIDEETSYRAGQRLGRDLSELHRWQSVMQRVLDEVGRTRVPVGALGLRHSDISRHLANLSIDGLLNLGKGAISLPVWPLVCIDDNVVDVATYELLFAEERHGREVGWQEGAGENAEVGAPPPSAGEIAFRAFNRTVAEVVADEEPVSLERFLIAEDFPRTCYRMTLLALEDEGERGRVTIDLEPGPGREIFSDFVSEMSAGRVIPRVDGLETTSPIASLLEDFEPTQAKPKKPRKASPKTPAAKKTPKDEGQPDDRPESDSEHE
ncbi:MAG: hypothetical protein ACI9OJ_000279 [Myxococcota bacterium]